MLRCKIRGCSEGAHQQENTFSSTLLLLYEMWRLWRSCRHSPRFCTWPLCLVAHLGCISACLACRRTRRFKGSTLRAHLRRACRKRPKVFLWLFATRVVAKGLRLLEKSAAVVNTVFSATALLLICHFLHERCAADGFNDRRVSMCSQARIN